MSTSSLKPLTASAGAKPRLWLRWLLLVAWVSASLGLGCSSTGKKDPDRFAAVEIHGRPAWAIRGTTAQVFREHEFKTGPGNLTNFIFEKEGSTMNNIAYGNWMGTGIGLRVKIAMIQESNDTILLDCRAFLVRNRGEATEEEIKIGNSHSAKYQKLLDEVANRLKSPEAAK